MRIRTTAAAAVVFAATVLAMAAPATAGPTAVATGPGGQPIDAHGNPVAVPRPQPRFDVPRPAQSPLPRGWTRQPGDTLAEVNQQAARAQGPDARKRGKPAPGSAGEGRPWTPAPPKRAGGPAAGTGHGAAVAAHGAAAHDHGSMTATTGTAPPTTGTTKMATTQRVDGTGDAPSFALAAAVAPQTAGPTPIQGPTGMPAAQAGRWTLGPNLPSPSIHSVVLNTGKVLIIAGSQNQWQQFAAGSFTSALWDPRTNTFKNIATPHDMFCNGHVILRDGRVLVAGGTTGYPVYDAAGNLARDWTGSKKSYVFDPISETYQATEDMNVGRWYPTLARMGNDQVVAVAGLDDGSADRGGLDTPVNEVFTPSPDSTWDAFRGGEWDVLNSRAWPQYAHMVLTDDGELFYTGQSTANNGQMPGLWEPYANTLQEVPGLPNRWQRNAGGSVLLPPAQDQKVMVMGGGDWQLQSLNDTHIVDLDTEQPTYTPGPPMANPKMYVGAVTLPDYTVLQTNGSLKFRDVAVRDAQVYDPAANAWTTMNSPTVDRLYHSTAFLLPDGRVAALGSQTIEGTNELRMEIFQPPYLFKGQRPTIGAGPTWIGYDSGQRPTWQVGTEAGATVSRVSLLRPSATTHSTDTEQRLVDLPFTVADGAVSVTVPTNRNLLPPGWYMLTVLDDKGRPSVAKWVSLN